MKIEINIEKKHLYFFAIILVLIGIGFVMAVDNPGVFHEILYTDIIKSHSGGKVTLETPVTDQPARLDFADETANDLWSIMYKNDDDNKRLLFTYYNGAAWKEAAYFDTDGDLNLKQKICDNSGCYTLSELAGDNTGEPSEPNTPNTYNATFLENDLKINGKFIDYSNAQEFCEYKNYETVVSETRTSCGDIIEVSYYSDSTWGTQGCQTGPNEGYLTEVKCSVEGSVKEYNLATEDDIYRAYNSIDYSLGVVGPISFPPITTNLENTANEFCKDKGYDSALNYEFLPRSSSYSIPGFTYTLVCNAIKGGSTSKLLSFINNYWGLTASGGCAGTPNAYVITKIECIDS